MRTRGAAERGETLIELIVAVAIMGAAVVVLLGALAAAVANATRQKAEATGQTVLNAFAEQAREVDFIPCATPGDYNRTLAEVSAAAEARDGYLPGVTRVAAWDGSAYRARTLSAIDESASTIQVQDAAGLPPESESYAIKVDGVDAAGAATTEPMTVTGRVDTTLTVTRTAGIRHVPGDAVSVCPPDPPESRYQAQVLDIGVTGPEIAQLGTSERYAGSMSVAKRGPLQVPTLRARAVPDPAAKAGVEVTLTDEATLSDARAPTEKMSFRIYAPHQFDPVRGVCTDTPDMPAGTDEQVLASTADEGVFRAEGVVRFIPLERGTYRWVAAYPGDAVNEGVTGACGADGQQVEVAIATPTLTTIVRRPPGGSPTVVGDVTQVAARLGSGAAPMGEITFTLYGPQDNTTCTGDPVSAPHTQPVAANGEDTLSLELPFTVRGTYRWQASYSGDANNMEATSPCPEDPIVVEPAP